MADHKIDRVKLNQMLTSGKSQRAIAQFFGVTEGAVSKAKKELKISVVRSVTLERAHQVVDKNLNAVDQLQKINSYANELLDLLMQWNRGDKTALQVLESQVKKVRVKGKEEEVTEFKFKDPRELALRAMAEIRGQLSLQLEIFKTLYDLEAVADFQREVLTTIGEVDRDARNRIVQRLKERKALRGSVSIA
ncbi:MAG: hypothetical protein M0009_06570 [Deltaproteobacteria bacterium]|nr:hypothetical protein [Deltaproteobacteria bacterium]